VGETVVGEVCHIKGEKVGSARHDDNQPEDERHGYENLVLMCRKHHRVIDSEEESYPVEKLIVMKKEHEESDTRRYTISDELGQRLGAILASEADNGARAKTVPFPDMTIRELFFHIRPDLLEEAHETRWVEVGRNVMDHFSTGRLRAWGRPIYPVGRMRPMKAVDEPGYWMHAEFSYWFLQEGKQRSANTWVKTETGLPDYADLQVNREEALRIWPEPGKSADDRTEILLIDAARRAYSETRGLPAAEHAEMSNASAVEILKCSRESGFPSFRNFGC
jgi:hypothetical protein